MTRTVDPFDELAALFMGPSAQSRLAAPTIEVAVVGHLPVRAGLWLTPFADARARESGPTALVRLDADEPSIEFVRGDGDAPPSAGAPASLKEAINDLAGTCANWLIRPDARSRPADLVLQGADRVCILSSADQAAVVAAYQIVKQISEAAAESDKASPSMSVVVLGAKEDRARQMMTGLNQTTSTFLDIELPLALCVSQMDAGVQSTRFHRFPGERCPDVHQVTDWIREAHAGPAKRGEDDSAETLAVIEPVAKVESAEPAPVERPVMPGGPSESLTEVVPPPPASLTFRPVIETPPRIEVPTPAATAAPRERGERPVPTGARSEPNALGAPIGPSTSPIKAPVTTLPPPARSAALPTTPPVTPEAAPPAAQVGAPSAPAPPTDRPLIDRIVHAASGLTGSRGGASPEIQTKPMPPAPAGAPIEPLAQTTKHAHREPAPMHEPKITARATEPDDHGRPVPLATHLPGVEPLVVRCPGREHIELGVDASGRLHVICREHFLRELAVVETWAKSHRDLIAMACPQHKIDSAGRTVGHVFTETPVRVADLHDTAIHLHVLAPVEVNGQTGWYAAALNQPGA